MGHHWLHQTRGDMNPLIRNSQASFLIAYVENGTCFRSIDVTSPATQYYFYLVNKGPSQVLAILKDGLPVLAGSWYSPGRLASSAHLPW
jgi:hypothetical protein